MTQFQFRYHSLVQFRRMARDNCRAVLAGLYLTEQKLQTRLESLQSELERCQGQSRSAAGCGQVDLRELARARRYERVLAADRRTIGQQMDQIQCQIEAGRLAAVEAERQVKVLERLEADQRDHFEQLQQRSTLQYKY